MQSSLEYKNYVYSHSRGIYCESIFQSIFFFSNLIVFENRSTCILHLSEFRVFQGCAILLRFQSCWMLLIIYCFRITVMLMLMVYFFFTIYFGPCYKFIITQNK